MIPENVDTLEDLLLFTTRILPLLFSLFYLIFMLILSFDQIQLIHDLLVTHVCVCMYAFMLYPHHNYV